LAGSDHQALVEGRFPKHRGVYLGRVVQIEREQVIVRREVASTWTGGRAAAAPAAAPQGQLSSPLPLTVEAAPLQLRAGLGVGFDQGRRERDEPGGPLFSVQERGGELVLGFGQPGPDLSAVRPGDRVFVTSDGALAARAERLLRAAEPDGRVGLRLEVGGRAGAPLTVTARSGAVAATASSGELLAAARGAGLDEALLRQKLGAFGGTPFRVDAL